MPCLLCAANAVINMFTKADQYLLGKAPAAMCRCCCCKIPLRAGVLWAAYILILEALWHIGISLLRPLWEWNSSLVTIIAFLLQDIARVVVLVATTRAIMGVKKYTSKGSEECSNVYLVKVRIQFLWRVTLSLVCLEMLEMCVKFFEVETICDASYVTEMRHKRHPNITADQLKAAQDHCMLISDLYDYGLELITIALLIYLTWVTHSYGRSIKGPTVQQQNTSSSSDDKPSIIIGEVVATSDVAADV